VTITLKPEQERVIREAIVSGLARTPDEALDRAFDALRARLPEPESPSDDSSGDSVAAAARRLATFGKRNGLSLGGITVKELIRESRP
jgi:hypothetical protein